MTLNELCTRETVFVTRNESVLTAARLMRDYHVGDVVVVEMEDGRRRPVGILTDRDIVLEVTALDVDPRLITASDAMSDELISMEGDADLFDATARMRHYGVRRLVVVDAEDALIGVISVDDVLDVLAEEMTNIARVMYREREVEQRTRSVP